MNFDFDEATARVVADPLERVLFDRLGRERVHPITVQRVNRLALFASTRQPVTIRQCYYHLDVSGLIAKTEVGYAIVVELMNQMLDAEIIDPDWVVDLSREPLIWPGYDSPAHAIRAAADGYYKNLWLNEPHYLQFWIEKQGLIETVRSPCLRRCMSLWPARGYSSRSFLRRAVKEIVAADKPAFVYAFGDYDAAGWDAHRHINEMLASYANKAGFRHGIKFERVALSPEQIDAGQIDPVSGERASLPTRNSKERDDNGRPIPSAPAFRAMQVETLSGRMARLIGQSCELDAMDPADLRGLIENRGRRHLSDERLAELEEQEAVEKAEMLRIADRLTGRR
jgi:hypothetical protein